MDELLRHIKEEWSQLVKAPGAFAILVILAFIAAFAVIEWAHSAKISGLEQQVSTVNSLNDLLKERIAGKDDQLTDYRAKNLELQGKLPSISAPQSKMKDSSHPYREQLRQSATRYSNASNRELAQAAILLANNIRDAAQAERNRPIETKPPYRNDGVFEYQSRFQGDAIVLRDEMLSRLPFNVKREPEADMEYSHANNPIGFEMVASDLDRLAKLLPIK
jgi:hypothetical protein